MGGIFRSNNLTTGVLRMKKFKIVALVSLLAIAGVAVAQQLCSPAACYAFGILCC